MMFEDPPRYYKIVFQKDHTEILHFNKSYDTSNEIPEWLVRDKNISDKDLWNNKCWVNNRKRMPEEERKRAKKYVELGLSYMANFGYLNKFEQFFICTWCPQKFDTFDPSSPRSVVLSCYIIKNTLVIHGLGLTIQGWLWEIEGGDEKNCIPGYKRTRENSTEPMMENFIIYMLKHFPELKYGVVQGTEGTRSLLETWFELEDIEQYSLDHDDVPEKAKFYPEIFELRTPYFNNILKTKRNKVDINCNVCNRLALFQCDNCQIGFYCGKNCQKMDWKFHKNKCYF
jgi:hypothetical protein